MRPILRYPKKNFSTRNFKYRNDNGKSETPAVLQSAEAVQKAKKNNRKKDESDMLTKEQIEQIEAQTNAMQPEVKVSKKDRGLIERTESSKIVLTEDNRQVLNY